MNEDEKPHIDVGELPSLQSDLFESKTASVSNGDYDATDDLTDDAESVSAQILPDGFFYKLVRSSIE